ncbi:hypothetical protein [Sutterella wadsworthensis]|uniref:hypothetical protein n=1 Tax=Sutterella wadsworthensis TaxID=40545 RepID=UPI0032C13846
MTDNLLFGHIHNAYIAFEEDTTRGKLRPVLVIKEKDDLYVILQITSSEPSTKFQRETRYKIVDWKEAGLDVESYIKLYPKDYRAVDSKSFQNYRGFLTDKDKLCFTEKIKETAKFLKDNPQYK